MAKLGCASCGGAKKMSKGGSSIPKAQLGRFLVKERPISDLNNAAKIADNTTVKEKKSGKSVTKNHRSYMQTNGETANFKSRTVRNADGSVKKKNGWATPIVAKQKRGGAIKPLRKKQSGGNSGPLTESDSNALDSMYPSSSSVRIPAAPKKHDENSEITGYGGDIDPVDYEMKGRMSSEKGIRSSPDFNNGSVYKKGGATKMKKMQKGGVTGSEQGKGSKIARMAGKVIPVIGAAAIAVKAGVNKMKQNQDVRQAARANKKQIKSTAKENKATAKELASMKRKGGPVKYAMGGSAGIVGMPKYGNNPRTQTGAMVKKGGAIKAKFGASVPVQRSPAPGRVRSASGVGTVPVGKRKMGGTTKKK